MKKPEIPFIKLEGCTKISFIEWERDIEKKICKEFKVEHSFFTSPGVVDPTIEAINSSEPDILDINTDPYRKERKVN